MRAPILLLVDDNPNDIDFLREAFAELALAVELVVAQDGAEALAILGQVLAGAAPRPAGVLLDLNMPRVNGRDVLSFIKGTRELAAIPTIIVTSSSSPKDRCDCLAKGADAYFTKPGTLEQLDALAAQIHRMIAKGPEPARCAGRSPAAGMAALIDLLAWAWTIARGHRRGGLAMPSAG